MVTIMILTFEYLTIFKENLDFSIFLMVESKFSLIKKYLIISLPVKKNSQ